MKDSTRKAWITVCIGIAILILLLPSIIVRRPLVRSEPACIANLKQIQGAIEQYALESHKSSNDVVTITDISGGTNTFIKALINSDLHCPQGGTYRVTRVGDLPTCSIPGHTL